MNLDDLRADFRTFADLGSEVVVLPDAEGASVIVRWRKNKRDHEAVIRGGDEAREVVHAGRAATYAGFFASDTMGDIAGLADAQIAMVRGAADYVSEREFVNPRVVEVYDGGLDDVVREPRPGIEAVLGVVAEPRTDARTRVLFVQGRAGDGKSSLLKRLTERQAQDYAEGRASWMFLYLDAQGVALGQLEQLVAVTLQDLRSAFTYHSLSTLVRLGALVPIIDGFDELLGPNGYKGAFSSLKTLVRRLQGSGAVIASARASFYQTTTFKQEFLSDSSLSATNYEQHQLRLLEWGPSEYLPVLDRVEFKSALGVSGADAAVEKLRSSLGSRADEVLSSPFLLNRLKEQAPALLSAVNAGSPIFAVVEDLLVREANKIVVRDGSEVRSILNTDNQVKLLSELAEEMWWQESLEVDRSTFDATIELACEALQVPSSHISAIYDKLRVHAALRVLENPERFSFRHELYHAAFLGEVTRTRLASGDRLLSFLTRAVLPLATADHVAERARSVSDHSLPTRVLQAASLPATPAYVATLRQNVGTLVAALIRRWPECLSGREIAAADIDGIDLTRTSLTDARFRSTALRHVDLRGARWSKISFDSCDLIVPAFDDETRLEAIGLRAGESVRGLRLSRQGRDSILYDPREIAEVFNAAGIVATAAPEPLPGAARRIDDLSRFLNVIRTTLYFSEEDFQRKGKSLQNDFGGVFEMLLKHGLLEEAQSRAKSGNRRMWRLTVLDEIVREGGATAPDRVRAFWADMARD